MGDSVWGRFSAFTDQLSQLTREVIADEDVDDKDDRLEPGSETPEDDNEAFFVEDDDEGGQDTELARLKSIIATQKRELAGRQKDAQDMKAKWAASQTGLQKLLATKQEEIASLQRENLQLADVRGKPGLKDFPTSAGPGNVGAPSPARSPSVDSLHDLTEIESEKRELSGLLSQTKEENEHLRRRVAELSGEKKARSGSTVEEIASLQAQHQERLQKIVEAHNQDLTLLQETDAALAEERRRVADLERENKNLTQLASAATLRPPSSDNLAQQPQPLDDTKRETELELREAREENDKLKQTVLELQRKCDLQQDAMAKLKSDDEGTIGMMQALITEKERLLAEREELVNIFRSLSLDVGRAKSVVSLARQVGDKLKASEQQKKLVVELEATLRGAAEEKSRLAGRVESLECDRDHLRGEAQQTSTEMQRLQTELAGARRTAHDGAETEVRERERLRTENDGLREDLKVAERQRDGERAERERLQRELEMERRERDIMMEESTLNRAGEVEERLQTLERERSALEKNVRLLEMRRREWVEKEMKWDADRAELQEKQRVLEQELSELRTSRAEREQILASTEEQAQKQNEELVNEMRELRVKCEGLEQNGARLQQQLDEAREALLQAGSNAVDAQRVVSLEAQLEEAKKKLEKANKDSERLRMHLIDTEDTHNLQLIEQQKKIDELTKRLEDYEGREHHMNDVLARYDQLTDEYKEKQIECEETTMALMNLQTVLEQFQSQKEAEVRYEIASLHKQMAAEQDKVRKLSHDLEEASRAYKRCEEAERQIQKLHEELSQKSREVVKLREEAEPIRKALEESMRRLHSATENGKTLVDKRLVAKLVATYFSRQSNQAEVLNIMSSILEFTEDEKVQVGLVKPKKRWLFFGGGGEEAQKDTPKEKTLADLWVEFLLQEASENAEDKQAAGKASGSGSTTTSTAAMMAVPKDWERKLSQISAAANTWPSSPAAPAAAAEGAIVASKRELHPTPEQDKAKDGHGSP